MYNSNLEDTKIYSGNRNSQGESNHPGELGSWSHNRYQHLTCLLRLSGVPRQILGDQIHIWRFRGPFPLQGPGQVTSPGSSPGFGPPPGKWERREHRPDGREVPSLAEDEKEACKVWEWHLHIHKCTGLTWNTMKGHYVLPTGILTRWSRLRLKASI